MGSGHNCTARIKEARLTGLVCVAQRLGDREGYPGSLKAPGAHLFGVARSRIHGAIDNEQAGEPAFRSAATKTARRQSANCRLLFGSCTGLCSRAKPASIVPTRSKRCGQCTMHLARSKTVRPPGSLRDILALTAATIRLRSCCRHHRAIGAGLGHWPTWIMISAVRFPAIPAFANLLGWSSFDFGGQSRRLVLPPQSCALTAQSARRPSAEVRSGTKVTPTKNGGS